MRTDRIVVISRTVFVPAHTTREQQSVKKERTGLPAEDRQASRGDRAANERANFMGPEETLAIQ